MLFVAVFQRGKTGKREPQALVKKGQVPAPRRRDSNHSGGAEMLQEEQASGSIAGGQDLRDIGLISSDVQAHSYIVGAGPGEQRRCPHLLNGTEQGGSSPLCLHHDGCRLGVLGHDAAFQQEHQEHQRPEGDIFHHILPG